MNENCFYKLKLLQRKNSRLNIEEYKRLELDRSLLCALAKFI